METKTTQRNWRHQRVRAKIKGTAERPRLSIFKSNRHLYAQLIDDEKGRTISGVSDVSLKKGEKRAMTGNAELLGAEIAKHARAKKITKVVFDRGGFPYTGVVRAFAEAARKGGLQF